MRSFGPAVGAAGSAGDVGFAVAAGKVEVGGKGGGTFTFTRLAFSDGDGQVSSGISGTVSWTCKN